MQIASVMGMLVSVDLLQATYPIAANAEALEKDLLELERANFLRPTDVPGTWLMTQVCDFGQSRMQDALLAVEKVQHNWFSWKRRNYTGFA